MKERTPKKFRTRTNAKICVWNTWRSPRPTESGAWTVPCNGLDVLHKVRSQRDRVFSFWKLSRKMLLLLRFSFNLCHLPPRLSSNTSSACTLRWNNACAHVTRDAHRSPTTRSCQRVPQVAWLVTLRMMGRNGGHSTINDTGLFSPPPLESAKDEKSSCLPSTSRKGFLHNEI